MSQQDNIFYLAYLVNEKNDLNRKRRRYWSRASRYYRLNKRYNKQCKQWLWPSGECRREYTKLLQKYQAMAVQCRQKTPKIKKICKQLNVRFTWSPSDYITSIRCKESNKILVDSQQIITLAYDYVLLMM